MLDVLSFLEFGFALTCFLLVFLKKNIFIKVIFLNVSTSLMSLFICFFSSFKGNGDYIDIAIIYQLFGIISSMGYLKYFIRKKN